jgi:predicted methyltransferase
LNEPRYSALGMTAPLLTRKVHDALLAAARAGAATVECSLDLERTQVTVQVDADGWSVANRRFAHLQRCKDRTIYHWTGSEFEPVARFTTSLIKLVPTEPGKSFELPSLLGLHANATMQRRPRVLRHTFP